MYGSTILSFGIVSDITTSYSSRTEKHTLRVILDFPGLHFASDTDYFYSYDLTILDKFEVGQKVFICAKRSINKGAFIRLITSDPNVYKAFVLSNYLDKFITEFYKDKLSDIYTDEEGLDIVG